MLPQHNTSDLRSMSPDNVLHANTRCKQHHKQPILSIFTRMLFFFAFAFAFAFAFVSMFTGLTPACAQPTKTAPLPLEAPVLDNDAAYRAYSLVEQSFIDGRMRRGNLAPIQVSNLIGIKLTLRVQGVTVAEAAKLLPHSYDAALDEAVRGKAINLASVTAELVQDCHQQILARMKTPEYISLLTRPDQTGQVLTDDQLIQRLAGRILVDLQLAHSPKPIDIKRTDPPNTIIQRYAPGYHGLIAYPATPNNTNASPRSPDALDGPVLWPGTTIARNLTFRAQLAMLAGRSGLPKTEFDRLGRRGNPALHQFQVIHLTRADTLADITELKRGGTFVLPNSINQRTLDERSERLLLHLKNRFVNGEMRGRYMPTSDNYKPLIAKPDDVALTAFAISRRANLMHRETFRADAARQHVRDVQPAVVRMVNPQFNQEGTDALTEALTLLSILDAPVPNFDDTRQALVDSLIARQHEGKTLGGVGPVTAEKRNSNNKATNIRTHGLVMLALATQLQRDTISTRRADPVLAKIVYDGLTTFWEDLTRNESSFDPGAAAWYAAALFRSKAALRNAGLISTTWIVNQEAGLEAILNSVANLQIIRHPEIGPPDVLGGFNTSRTPHTPSNAPPNPTWRTVDFLLLYAICLQEESFQRSTRVGGWVLTAQAAARFMAQLMIDQPETYYALNPEEALGGVRLALFDNRLSPEPTAMTLLAFTELQTALENLQFE